MKLSTAVLAKWQSYFKLRDDGTTVELAAARAGLSPSSAYRYERGEESAQGMRAALALERGDLPVAAVNELTPAVEPSEASGTEYLEPIRTTEEGQKALKDFAYFRFRYFGRKSMPWQVRAAEQVAVMLSTKDREYVVMNEPPGSGKALSLDTPLPTPMGWTTMGEVRPGDYLLGEHGQPVRVLAATDTLYDRDCYEVRTDDGDTIVADGEHQWLLRKAGLDTERIYTTKFLALGKMGDGRPRPKKFQNRLSSGPAPWPSLDLPVDPYLVGVWAGDGCHSTSSVCMDDADAAHVRRYFEAAGYATTDRNHPYQFGVLGIARKMQALMGKGKKIPEEYLSGSPAQRLAVLQGLMDSDGHVRTDGLCVFSNTRKSLVLVVQRLVWSLGYKCSINSHDPGGTRRVANYAFFYMPDAARLPRKAERCLPEPHKRSRHRGMTARPVESVPVRCVQVEGELYLAGRGMVLTHNSTLFSHDVLCWMICRDRTIRIQIGSRTERQARMYVGRIKRSLERPSPMLAVVEDKERGLAFDAEATLEGDYGVFRPGGREDLWRAEGLVVRQPSGVALDDKEPTVSAWGMDSGFLGGRFDLVVWDDLVDRKNTATVEARDKLAEWYFTEAETRLEPGGLFLLQGQRIAADDLYRTALDQVRFDGSTKYSHIVYPAHDESKCNNVHGKRARPWPEGCLLDPYRLPWHQLETIRHNNPRIFSVMYQQTDGMGIGGLVEQAWLEGGVDSEGYESVGCYDLKRIIKQPPVGHEAMFSFITVDPSPTEWWGVLRWLYDPTTQIRHLMDIRRLKMRPDDWLWFDMATGEYTGELVKMIEDSDLEGNRVSHVIVEINAAQRWLLSQPHVQSWQSQERVHFIQHTTNRNKLDPEYGVETIAPFFREGRVRIPWGNTASRIEFRPLVDELLRYPEGQTTDLVMSTWFSVLAVDHHYQGDRRRAWSKTTVPWFRSVRRGIA